jgi:hypothetical protein
MRAVGMLFGFMLVLTATTVVSIPPFPDGWPPIDIPNIDIPDIDIPDIDINESEIEERLKEWQRRWREKFNGTTEEFKEKWKNVTENFRRMKENHSFLGWFSYENGYGVGNFVRFLFDDGDIVGYTVIREENIAVFDFVRIENFSYEREPQVYGMIWRVDGEDEFIEIHDNPTALLKVKAKNPPSTVQLNLAEGIRATPHPNNPHVMIVDGNIEGRIILHGDGEFTISNDSISVTINAGLLLFMAFPTPEVCINLPNHRERRERVAEAIADGIVCAELLVQADNRFDEMVYSDVEINCTSSKGKVRVEITATGEGKTLVLNVHKEVLNTIKVTVKLNGKVIPKAEDYDDVLDIGINEGAEYLILIGSNGVQVLISIPSFSTHSIEITEKIETPGFELLAIMIVVLFVIILRKKR